MRSMTLNEPSPFPPSLRKDIECICDSIEIRRACKEHTKSPGGKILDIYFADQLASRGYSVKRDRLWVVEKSKFDLDLLINGPDWRVAVLIEGGQAARVDLDLLKFIAWSKREDSPANSFTALIVSDKELHRSITGTTGETAFDYAARLLGLFGATGPQVADLLVVEFPSEGSQSENPVAGNLMPKHSLRRRVIERWKAAGHPQWTYEETERVCLQEDHKLAEEHRNPAPQFRKFVEMDDKRNIRRWILGCHFPWLNPRKNA